MALAIDSSTPAFLRGPAGGNTSYTSNTFSPPANSLLVVLFTNGGDTTKLSSVSDSLGTSLSYSKLVAIAAEATDTEIWVANCPSAHTNMTVNIDLSATTITNDTGLGVVVFTGAATIQSGATQSSSSAGAAPSATLTTTANNSWVIGAIANFSSSTLPTVPGGQTDVFNGLTFAFQNTGSGTSGWGQAQSATTASSSTNVTINDTAPTIQYSMVIAEILAVSSGTSTATVAWMT